VGLCVCLSVHEDISGTTRAIFVRVAYVRGSVFLRRVYDRPHRQSMGRGFSSPLKMRYRPGKGNGSAHRGRSMLSTIVLFLFVFCVFLVKQHAEFKWKDGISAFLVFPGSADAVVR